MLTYVAASVKLPVRRATRTQSSDNYERVIIRLKTGRPIGTYRQGVYSPLPRSSSSDPDCLEVPYQAKDLKQPEHNPNHNDDIEDILIFPAIGI
jgi:hypothetical protein